MYKRSIAMSVGVFIIIVIFCLIFLALRVSGLSLSGGGLFSENFYHLSNHEVYKELLKNK